MESAEEEGSMDGGLQKDDGCAVCGEEETDAADAEKGWRLRWLRLTPM